jgi:hypothetical protein
VARNETPWSRDYLLKAVGVDQLEFPPGTGWAYSNIGYMFVREAIEEATALPLSEALRELVLDPSQGLVGPPCDDTFGFARGVLAHCPDLRSAMGLSWLPDRLAD